MATPESLPTTPSTKCTHCAKIALKQCGGCKGSPSYVGPQTSDTFYCDPECQKANWIQHKRQCKRLQTRIRLHRAAGLLEEIMKRVRKHAYPIVFRELRFEGKHVHLDGYQPIKRDAERQLKPAPFSLTDADPRLLEAALMYMSYKEAMRYLARLAQALLGDFSSRIEEVSVRTHARSAAIGHSLTPAIRPDGSTRDEADPNFHDLYRVTLQNGEIWAVDLVGA
ncbi:hypothetical protein DL98DRAFT_571074 [Cadophora sp. DSE1049]|nr:hypothetical protein DL98DRAFT_571074 [Cadophora sp. DSE1049]